MFLVRPEDGRLQPKHFYSKNSVLLLLYLNIVPSWPEDGRLWLKHVAKYNLIVIIASCLEACCVLTVHNIIHKFDIHNVMASLKNYEWMLIS